MKNIKLMYDNFFDAVTTTVTALTTNPDFPLANLIHPWWSRAHHTIGHDHQWWKWNIGVVNGAIGLESAIFKYHNFSANSTIGLYGHDTDLGDDPAVWIAHGDTLKVPLVYGVDWNSKILCKYWNSLQTFQWWLLSVDDPDNAVGHLILGRPYGGPWFSPFYNFTNAYTVRLADPSIRKYSLGGQLSSMRRLIYRGMKYEFQWVVAADKEIFEEIFEDYVGMHTPYFLCRDSDKPITTTSYVENVTDWEFPHIQMDQLFSFSFEVKESA